MSEDFDSQKFHRYHSGEFYEPSERTSDFPFLKGDDAIHKNLKLAGKFKGYDKIGKEVMGIVTMQDGTDMRDNILNWQVPEK